MKIKLKEITISAFLNIAEEQTVVFDSEGVYSVTGVNKDEGGSNASGKTAFLRAITVLFLGSKHIDITNKEIKNRILGLPAKVSGKCEINGKDVSISRIVGGKLTVSIDGVELDGKTDEIQDKLIKLMEITPEHFVHLTHKMQGSFGGFLLMKDSEKKDFLGSFFDTSKIDKANDLNSTRLQELNKEVLLNTDKFSQLTGSMNILRNEVNELTEKVKKYTSSEFIGIISDKKNDLTVKENELAELTKHSHNVLNSDEYLSMKSQLEKTQTEFNATKEINLSKNLDLQKDIEVLQKAINEPVTIPSEINIQLADIAQKILENKKLMAELNRTTAEINSALSAQKNAESKINNLKQDTCALCGQSIDMELFNSIKQQMQDGLNSHILEIEGLKEYQFQIKASIADETPLIVKKQELDTQIAQIKANNDKAILQSQLNGLKNQVNSNIQIIKAHESNVSNMIQSLNMLKRKLEENHISNVSKITAEINKINTEINSLLKESQSAVQSLDSVNSKYDFCVKSTQEIEISLKVINSELKVRNKISEVLSRNGFIGYIFDTVLEEINQEVNENIKQIPVISRLSMYFSPDHITKSTGNINKSIVYKIFDKNDEISFETMSGSEKESLLIAVEAAVDVVLCRRLGVDINYKILDEQFGWVDGTNKESLLEFIKNKYHDKMVLLVDHGSELNASIDKAIVATKQNGIATLSCQLVS